MVQKYHLGGLECASCAVCADCAAAIKREAQSWEDVKNASLDLLENKLVVDTDTDANTFMQRLVQCVGVIEPKIKVSYGDAVLQAPSCGCGHDHAVGHIHSEHTHEHGDACGCGQEHAHAHGDACGCGQEHAHTEMINKQYYTLENLACAHCAATIEHEVQGWEDVKEASLDLMSNKLMVQTATAEADVMDRLVDCVNRVEPKVHVKSLNKKTTTAANGKKQYYKLNHLACAHCAATIEHEVQEWEDVKSASLDLMSNKLMVETDTPQDTLMQRLVECVNRVEPKVEVEAMAGSAKAAVTSGKQQYTLEHLACAHCAATIEHEIQGWDDVSNVSLDMMKNILSLDTEVPADVMFERVKKCVAAVESNVVVKQKAAAQPAKKKEAVKPGLLGSLDGLRMEMIKFAIAVLSLIGAVSMEGTVASVACYALAYLVVGVPVLKQAVKAAFGGFIFNEQMLMGVASIGAMAVGEYTEGVAVMLFYTLGEILQEMVVNRSKRSIASLLDLRPDSVRIQTATGWEEVDPESVEVGTMIQVQPGERVPLDGVVVTGSASLDTSAITGESRLFDVAQGDMIQSGCVNVDGVLVIRVEKAYGDSTLARILSLVEDASARKAPAEKFITRFARYYTPVVVGLAAAVAILPPLLGMGEWQTWIYRGLVFLVVSCPCALVISVPLTYFAGIGGASRQHILVKGSQYLEGLAQIKQVAFDKTGTLTCGEFSVTQVIPTADMQSEELLTLAAALEQYASHPLAQAIVKSVADAPAAVDQYRNIAGQGISAVIDGKTYYIGNKRLMDSHGIAVDEAQSIIGTTVFLADDHQLLGIIVLEDMPKEGVREAMDALHALDINKTTILSGDRLDVVRQLADELHIDDVHGNLLPEDKIDCVEQMMEADNGALAFVGDGVNDAPVLARADIGIAMGGVGSDAAIEAADVVLMSDHPQDVVKAVKIARKTRRIALQNVVGALGFKGLLLILATLGMANMWMAVFADVGVCIICVINAMRAMMNPQ